MESFVCQESYILKSRTNNITILRRYNRANISRYIIITNSPTNFKFNKNLKKKSGCDMQQEKGFTLLYYAYIYIYRY